MTASQSRQTAHISQNVASLETQITSKADLDSNGKVPASQLPSYVDDVLEYSGVSAFPTVGAVAKLYVDTSSNDVYRWTGSTYIKVSDAVSTSDEADRLATARSISLSGDVTGSASFDGSADVTIAATVSGSYASASHTHSDATTSAAGFLSAADKTKLDGLEAAADVTDTANVVAALTAGTNVAIAADGTISATDTNTTYSDATGSAAGLMSAADKTKLDGVEASADVTDTANVVAALTAGSNVTIAADGTISSTDTNTTYSAATTSAAGLMSASDKTKLDGVETSADVTDTTNVVAALTAGTNVTIAADGTISSTDTDTTYSNATTSAAGLMSASDKTKLNGVEASADVTDTTNVVAALTAGTDIDIASDGTISHGTGTLAAGNYGHANNSQKIDTITLDAQGHVTAVTVGSGETWHRLQDDTNTRPLNDYSEMKITGGGAIEVTLSASSTGTSTDPHTFTIAHEDTSSHTPSNGTGAAFIQSVNHDTYGHVTDITHAAITPALIGAVSTTNNYIENVSEDTSPTLGGALDADNNSITNITTLSSNNLVLSTGGTLTSSANWAQGGTTAFTGNVTATSCDLATAGTGTLKVTGSGGAQFSAPVSVTSTFAAKDLGTNGLLVRSDDRTNDKAKVLFDDTVNNFQGSIGLAGTGNRGFELYAPPRTGQGTQKFLERDTSGNMVFTPSSGTTSRLTHNNIWQFGETGLHNGTDMWDSSATRVGLNINGNNGSMVQGSTSTALNILGYTGTGSPVWFNFKKNGTTVGSITTTSGGVAFNTSSDATMKDNIKDAAGLLAAVNSLMPKTYNFKGSKEQECGLIAQDIRDNAYFGQGMVGEIPIGIEEEGEEPDTVLALDYSRFVPHLIGAVKELSAQISALQTRIDALET